MRTWETFAYSVRLASGAELCEDKAKEIQQSELICWCEERDYFQVKQLYLCCLISIIVFTFLWYDLQFAPFHREHLQFYLTSIMLTEYFIVYSLIYSVLRHGDSGFVRCSNELYNRNKSLTKEYSLLCLVVVGTWILDYLYPSPIRKLNLNVTGVKFYNGRWTHVVNDPHTNHHQIKQNVLFIHSDVG